MNVCLENAFLQKTDVVQVVLGCTDADFATTYTLEALYESYKVFTPKLK